jgi:hypothetical protein
MVEDNVIFLGKGGKQEHQVRGAGGVVGRLDELPVMEEDRRRPDSLDQWWARIDSKFGDYMHRVDFLIVLVLSQIPIFFRLV